MVNDLVEDVRFKDHAVVVHGPFARFMACVPLRTHNKGLIIGAYVVIDDKPRDGLMESESQFLTDMAATVMDYMEASRIKQKEQRAEKMIKALSFFVEGKHR